MKKLFVAFLCIAVSAKLSAQINKGQWLAGGNINWTSSFNSYYNSNATVISIMPDAGYFFIDKLAGGLNLGDYRRGGVGDVADQIFDRQRVWHIALVGAEVAGQVANRAGREPFGALGECAGEAECRRGAFAHRAEFQSVDE